MNKSRAIATNLVRKIVAVVLISVLLSGCATIASQNIPGKQPLIYGGTAFHLEYFSRKPQDVLSLLIIDFPLSLVADTLILPVTIHQQYKYSKAEEFIEMVQEGNLSNAETILNEYPEILTMIVGKGTLLHGFAKTGQKEGAALLLKYGADINALTSFFKKTPLHTAVQEGNIDMVDFLLSNEADANARREFNDTPLRLAAEGGHLEIVRNLVNYGAKINNDEGGGISPFTEAATNGHEAVVKFLLDNGADVNYKDLHGSTAIRYAAIRGHFRIVLTLIEHGADVNDINDINNRRRVLKNDDSFCKARSEIVNALIEKGIDYRRLCE